MYGQRLPRSAEGLVDNGLGKAVAFGHMGILPPTQLISAREQEQDVDGVRFVFYSTPGAEAPAEMTFSLPELKAFGGAELLSQTLHNLYTLRGAKVRDALQWANYIDASRAQAAGAEVLFNQHHWPVWGQDNIQAFLTAQRDVYRYLHDQTCAPDECRAHCAGDRRAVASAGKPRPTPARAWLLRHSQAQRACDLSVLPGLV
ncbi:hypothetical protein [Pseudomonas aeruginosa]|uniref:hypothetical protein n=1 Tax=Pseudomonas aeruginosa TaxID=287 RepID=UPI0032AFCEC9